MTDPAWQRHRAARTAAQYARDAGDLAELLGMLGLSAEEGRTEPVEVPPRPRRKVPHLDRTSACRIDNVMRAAQRHPT